MTDFITTKAGLLVPAVAFADAAKEAPELNEIASIDKDPTKVFFGPIMTNADDTLLTRGAGKGIKIYEELERDTHAYSVLQKRKLAVVARKWTVTPPSDSADDKKAAEFITETLKNLPFDRICMELLDATNKGFAVGEIMWKVGQSDVLGHEVVVPDDVVARSQRRFVFGKDRDPVRGYPLRLLTRTNMIMGDEMPDRKFIVHRFGSNDGSPYGLGLGNKLFWPVFFKRQDIGFWLTFADKFGSPTAIGKYPRGAQQQEQTKLLNALRAIASDVGIIVPEGTEVELLEAARAGSIDTYEKLARYMDEQMSECVLGETMTTSAAGAGMGSNQASVHNEVRKEVAQADSDLLSDTLNRVLVPWLIDYNMPGAKYPIVSRNFEEEEDLDKRADRDTKIGQLGFEPSLEYITEIYGPGWSKKAAPPLATSPLSPAFSEAASNQRSANGAAQDAMATAASSFAEQYQALLGKRVEEILAIAEETHDLVEFRERIAELLDTKPSQELVDAVARAGFTAQLLARAPADSAVIELAEGAQEQARSATQALGKVAEALAARPPTPSAEEAAKGPLTAMFAEFRETVKTFFDGLTKQGATKHELELTIKQGKTKKTLELPGGRTFTVKEEDANG